jgi:Protein of unknown function with PCYCGC motif
MGFEMKMKWSLPLIAAMAVTLFAQTDTAQVPAFHKTPPAKGEKLAPILSQSERTGPAFQHDYQDHAYELAAKIPRVIYQLPCYCFCDRSVGHKSLHSCYESAHAAHCSACIKELYFAYGETKKGKTPTQIRAAIEKGDWEKVDLASAASIQ